MLAVWVWSKENVHGWPPCTGHSYIPSGTDTGSQKSYHLPIWSVNLIELPNMVLLHLSGVKIRKTREPSFFGQMTR